MSYVALKHMHLLTVYVTIIFFLIRAYWSLTQSPTLNARWVRALPHFIDSSLLGFGLYMMHVRQWTAAPWLWAKWAGLLLYIGFGLFALRRGKTQRVRVICTLLAIASFAYMLGTAYRKSVWSWLEIWING